MQKINSTSWKSGGWEDRGGREGEWGSWGERGAEGVGSTGFSLIRVIYVCTFSSVHDAQ